MPRKKLFAITAAAIGVSVALAVLVTALKSTQSSAAVGSASEAQAASGPESAGPHGGTLLKSGDVTLEVVLSEKPNDARLILYPSVGGRAVRTAMTASGKINWAQGTTEAIRFTSAGNKLTSEQPIAKPHVFDATISVTLSGKTTAFEFSRADGAIPLDPQQIKSAGISVLKSGPAEIATTIQVPGEIRFNEDRTAHVVPRVAGIVEHVDVTVGEKVRKGQVLAVLASTDLADRRSELLTAERRLSAAKTAYQREKTLWEERISAEQDFLQAQVQLREAEIATQNARQKLVALNAATSGGALNRYELRAAFDGTIVEKHITAGEAIAAETNVFTLSDLSTVWAEMAVPAQHLNDVRVGREATVKAAAFDSSADGRISYVGALLGEQTRSAPARVVLTNPDGAWRPGMFVNVLVNAGQRTVPVVVSSDALQDIDGGPVVFVETSKGFVAQPIKTGKKDDRVVEVVSGLSAGQQYVASNSFVLKAELGKGAAEEE
ncbi:efflux RND transporter periplasmic adaptor subunit [Caballeronia sp. LZ062]|uniref:efflux RND transporter periplasmic adaptor subunit n=1 Tax=unclassified Caballeronia TaxID=2646786 RepID=UPI002855F8B5|nr:MULTISPECIES: efflux RND transporter periplasmic adaptor subunit [unclassified Caballeronia]MDR5855762.1 efflux RND transporter periplasmic adaptor subunit [Caballeronia sp. LZ050]MDR5872451.1 efflux RND transporter periplasmic adaptor subunit [Caballeronia sp. LZ062]